MAPRDRKPARLPIHTEDVKESPTDFRLETAPDWWLGVRAALGEPEAGLARPFVLAVQGHRLGRRLLFRGRLQGEIELSCVRCLEPLTHAVNEPLQLLLEPAPDPALVPESGILLDPDDVEVGGYAGEELDFDPVVMEILALAWPMQPICAESCLGLCPVCGSNRNEESCDCSEGERIRPLRELGQMLEARRRGDPERG